MNLIQRFLSNTKFVKRVLELEDLAHNSNLRATMARVLSRTQGGAKYHNILNHRIDVVLFNKKKFWWMKRRKFEV